jgi:hypothetical protein
MVLKNFLGSDLRIIDFEERYDGKVCMVFLDRELKLLAKQASNSKLELQLIA